MPEPTLLPIVEGHGEIEATPVLIRRIIQDEGRPDVKVARPFRIKRQRIVREGELERSLQVAIADRSNASAVVLLIDADDDCPGELGPSLLSRSREILGTIPVSVVCAKMEFESWFLGSQKSLRGVRGIKDDVEDVVYAEMVRDAKGFLSRNMIGNRTYLPADDQPALASEFDIEVARRNCPSLDKFIRDIGTLVRHL